MPRPRHPGTQRKRGSAVHEGLVGARELVGTPYLSDPALRAVYPSKDLGPAEEHLRLFLIQYWGGPATYNELRGHPRLRMRHRHFAIGEAERDAWLRHMRAALDQIGLEPALDAQLWDYLIMAANSLINVPTGPDRPDLGLSPA